ncbi:hypothetical protein HanRHA438_Chr11g0509721 [Helianthus annuus]|uniref:Uncharacterized protein n=1 Tax=Helianthus annuus TaxID=4232 RepID=A0A9K3HQB8_HELAN|nr:hypothetical protein HanXRQr2_Chr11g0497121 [Helianthus annuus]KAJ0502024.1 hypothetical protein HanHA300_Chr11g0407801 [Helianthus annuus]KAJ0509977.1 hypothetical protein HanIR_Chr11g0535231 [Helianthus annuus]KAJ0517948.1 hypothetical protein HanHA89_Chr11g0431501 [Helianthus annuus]KAJ0685968.1 hypothetical protein HanLR1_Chr11g0409041 [Helianthus annuus]
MLNYFIFIDYNNYQSTISLPSPDSLIRGYSVVRVINYIMYCFISSRGQNCW